MRIDSLPVEFCQYILEKKLVCCSKLYLYLKYDSSGITQLPPTKLEYISKILGYKTKKTIHNQLSLLIKMNWIGYNGKTGNYFIRSYNHLGITNDYSLRADCLLPDIINLKAFAIGVLLACLVRRQRLERFREVGQKLGSSLQASRTYPSSYPVANFVLSKILSISMSTAHYYKKLALEREYVEIEKSRIILPIKPNEANYYRKANPDRAHKIVIKENKVWQYEPDLIKSNIKIFRRR